MNTHHSVFMDCACEANFRASGHTIVFVDNHNPIKVETLMYSGYIKT
jgi:hypothetical protein